MQDQIDGEDYSAYGSINYSAYSYTVSGTETWSPGVGNNPFNAIDTIYIKESIVIPFASVLNINNLTVKFAPNARIIIERGINLGGMLYNGGRLNLNSSTLTSDDNRCSANMWRGVEVRGKSSSAQGTVNNSVQGLLIMNNSTIKNAIKGAVALSYTKTTNGNNVTFIADNTYAGGIIQATNSFFINNQNDISLLNYTSQSANNLSRFTNCVFQTSSLLNIPSLNLDNHIFLNNVKGISILGCDFINSVPELFPIQLRGTGLAAISSSFRVEPKCMNMMFPCTQFDKGQFIGLTYGISSLSLSATLPYKCDRTIFINNAIGIYDMLSTGSKILRNSFEVSEVAPTNPSINQSTGVYLYHSTKYDVEENVFKEIDNSEIPNGTAKSYGIVVSNSGIENNLIYKNTFSNLKIGGQSEGINGRTIDPNNQNPVDIDTMMSGLQWKCNIFNSPIYSNDLTVIDGIIDYHQGYTNPTSIDAARKNAANNKFSLLGEGMGSQHDFFLNASSQHINYVYTTGNNYEPDSYTGIRMAVQPSQYNGSSVPYSNLGCPSKIIDGGIIISPPFKFNRLGGEKNPYGGRVLAEKNNELISYILTDTTLENRYSILNELLVENDDKEYQLLKAENQLYNLNYSLDEVLGSNLNLSDDEKKLLSIKNTLNREGIDILKDESQTELFSNLNEIINSSEDILLRKQAKLIYSFSKPADLTYYFLEDFSPKSMSQENSENQVGLDEVIVFPNPATNELTFKLDIPADKNVEVKVFSTLGNQVATWFVSENNTTVDISKLTNGIYFIQLQDVSGVDVQNIKFVKK